MHLEQPAEVTREAAPLGSTGHLLHKAILTKLGDIAALPNTYAQTCGGSPNGTKRNMSQIKEQEKSPEKELNEIEARRLADTQLKTSVITRTG